MLFKKVVNNRIKISIKTKISFSVVGNKNPIKTMHMQSISHWTPAKVEKILKGSLNSIPSPSVKIQIMGGKVCLRWKGKTLLGLVDKLLKT